MPKATFITLVTLVCYVAGKRTEIPPGKPVPDSLDENQLNELLESRSIERADAKQIEDRQRELAARDTQAEFEAERQKLQAARQANEEASEAAKAAEAAKKNKAEGGTGGTPPAGTTTTNPPAGGAGATTGTKGAKK